MANEIGMMAPGWRKHDPEDEDSRPERNVVALACAVDLEDPTDDAIVQGAEKGSAECISALERLAAS